MFSLRGSHSHGTVITSGDNATDDIDFGGVFFAPESHYLGVISSKETVEVKFVNGSPVDAVLYEWKHFLRMLIQNNPNIFPWLWLNPDHLLMDSPAWDKLVAIRDSFLCQRVFSSMMGYANSELSRIHRMSPETAERYQMLENALRYHGYNPDSNTPPKDIHFLAVWKEYKDLRQKYMSGFMGEKRRQKVLQYGYDVKAAAHMIRLLRMLCEILESREVIVDRTGVDADYLTAVKCGEMPFSEIQVESDILFARAHVAKRRNLLPELPDMATINTAVQDILFRYLHEKRSSFNSRRS